MTDEPDRVHETTLVIDELNENPPGRDRRHLDEEFVVFENDGTTRLDLSDWTVGDEAGVEYRFPPETALDPGERLTLRSGTGTDTERERYWGATEPVWANLGDTVVVRDEAGRVRIRYSYNE